MEVGAPHQAERPAQALTAEHTNLSVFPTEERKNLISAEIPRL